MDGKDKRLALTSVGLCSTPLLTSPLTVKSDDHSVCVVPC